MSSFESNLRAARSFLRPFRDTITGHHIHGERVVPAGSNTFDNISPVDNTSLGKVVAGSVEDVNAACEAAESAFADWRNMPGAARKKLLNHFADRIVARAEEIALVESMDCGQPIRFTDAGPLQNTFRKTLALERAPTEIGVQTVKGLLVDIYNDHLMPALEQVVTELGAHAPASDDNKIHKNYSFSAL